FLHSYRPTPVLHSFPTRRSSDLPSRRLVVRHSSGYALVMAGSGGLPSTRSAAFSAIISTHALMLPETRSGIAEASATRRPSTPRDRKSTRLNSSHVAISYAVFCL